MENLNSDSVLDDSTDLYYWFVSSYGTNVYAHYPDAFLRGYVD